MHHYSKRTGDCNVVPSTGSGSVDPDKSNVALREACLLAGPSQIDMDADLGVPSREKSCLYGRSVGANKMLELDVRVATELEPS